MKNILKSFFISVFPVYAIFIFIKTVLNSSFTLNHGSLLLSSLTVIVFFSMLFIKPTARTSKNLFPYSFVMLVSILMSFIDFNSAVLSINLSLVLGWLAYLKWYSTFNHRSDKGLEIGTKFPNFTLENVQKESVNTSSLKGNHKIFLFYRGNWCPLCMAQIKEVVSQYKELEKRKVAMILISSQPHKFTQNLANKFDIPFHFLTDIDNKMAKKLNIYHKNGLPFGFQALGYDLDVIMPTVIITDKNDKIIFADLTDNYRVRPEPELFFKIIDNHKA